ncbi:disulfide bond formation protein B [Anaplasmataceae bacterium AB001_6]|nr:disulfide bond formation protein B [Anaplasmataceae bacterium AB001_6]
MLFRSEIHEKATFAILFAFCVLVNISYVILASLGFKGCILCVYQRIPYIVNFCLGLLYIVVLLFVSRSIKIKIRNCIILLMFFSMLIDMAIAVYHLLVLHGIIAAECSHITVSDELISSESLSDLYDFIVLNKELDCSTSSLDIFGYPLAMWNFLSLLCIISLSTFVFYYDKKKATKPNY